MSVSQRFPKRSFRKIKIMTIFTSLASVLNFSCQSPEPKVLTEKKPKPVERRKPAIQVKDYTIAPGKVTLIQFPLPEKLNFETESTLFCDGKKTHFFVNSSNIAISYLSEDYYSERTNYQCHFHIKSRNSSFKDQKYLVARVAVTEFSYPKETLNVAKSKIFLSKSDQQRVTKERSEIERIYKNSNPSPLFSGPFHLPLKSYITSHYGTIRVFNNHKHTSHLGTDFRARIGTKIFSTNSGKVVFTGNTFYGGNSVIVDHGIGIFTSYAHLSKIHARTGEFVTINSLLGESGMTGRVNGPHLHWGVTVHQNHIDGHSLIDMSLADFNTEISPYFFSVEKFYSFQIDDH